MFNTDILQSKNLLVSAGEIFMILGFALKSQEFGNVIQYASILSLLPIFLSINNQDKKNMFIPVLGILSSFCMIFLISSPKPQMLHIVGCLFVFSFTLNFLNLENKNNKSFILFILTSILVINIQSKFSFVLGSSLLILYFIFFSIINHFLKTYALYLIVIF